MAKIFDCQQKIVTLLTADPFFADPVSTKVVPVISQRVGDIAANLQAQLQKLAVGVVVMLPLITLPEADDPQLMVNLRFAIAVTENPLLNKTGKPAEAIIEKVMTLLHYQPNKVDPFDETLPGRFMVDRNAVRQDRPPPPPNQGLLVYYVNVNTHINLN